MFNINALTQKDLFYAAPQTAPFLVVERSKQNKRQTRDKCNKITPRACAHTK